MEPTRDELKNEIENGPLATDLAPFWADVFGPHDKSELDWRIGILKPDAAFEIRKLLVERGRSAELGWGDQWSYELVVAAKGKTPKEAAPPPPAPVPPPPASSAPFRQEPMISFPPDMPPDIVRFHRIRLELLSQSDRGAAVLGGAYADTVLGEALKSKLRDLNLPNKETLHKRLFRHYGPLSTFSARIDMAFALYLIGENTRHDLDIIRDIRNDFAHDLEVGSPDKGLTFLSESVAARCNNLWFPKNDYYAKHSTWLGKEAHLGHPRGQYVFSVFKIIYLIRTAVMEWQVGRMPTVLT